MSMNGRKKRHHHHHHHQTAVEQPRGDEEEEDEEPETPESNVSKHRSVDQREDDDGEETEADEETIAENKEGLNKRMTNNNRDEDEEEDKEEEEKEEKGVGKSLKNRVREFEEICDKRRPISYPWGPETRCNYLANEAQEAPTATTTTTGRSDRSLTVTVSDPVRLCGYLPPNHHHHHIAPYCQPLPPLLHHHHRQGATPTGCYAGYSATGAGAVLGGGGGGLLSVKERVKVQVKPFTKESLERLERKTVQLVKEYGFQPRRKLSVEDGSRLPAKYEPFPAKLYGRPLEEIDNFIYDETFCVVSKRFRKNYIHRFTATNSVFLFSPWSPTRRACIYLSTNQYFDYIVMATILLNCVFLAMTETIEEAEYIFLAIYTAEMIVKSIAKGFILNKYTYLRNPWNWLDFVVITSGYATIGMDMGNLAGLRTFRVLRALKTISILPGLKTIINALLHSFKQLAEVMTLTIFCLMVFALFALQVYKGELRNKCVLKMTETNITNESWRNWTWNPSNWLYKDEDTDPLLCGNVTGSRHCPPSYTCLCVGENPNHGYTSFDNFLWSMLTTFQLITLDYWENVYNMVLSSCGPISVSFFTVVVFFGSFYLINLMLAVVALSYEEEAEITQEERKKELVDHREDSTFSFDPANINVKKLSRHKIKKIDARKGVLLSSYTRKKTRRRKRTRSGVASASSPSPSHHQQQESQFQQNQIHPNVPQQKQQQQNQFERQTANRRLSGESGANDVDGGCSTGVNGALMQESTGNNDDGGGGGFGFGTNINNAPVAVIVIGGGRTAKEASKSQVVKSDDGAREKDELPVCGESPSRNRPLPPLIPSPVVKNLQQVQQTEPSSNTLAPNRLRPHSRQTSSNSEGGNNRESSLDDSGVVDDHEEADLTSEDVTLTTVSSKKLTATTTTIAPNSMRVDVAAPTTLADNDKKKKCNGLGNAKNKKRRKKKSKKHQQQEHEGDDDVADQDDDDCDDDDDEDDDLLGRRYHHCHHRRHHHHHHHLHHRYHNHQDVYALAPDYLSHIVVIDDIPDRNCVGCERCCMDYTGWLQFQQALYRIVRDPLFELTITVCIVLNTMFLAMEHHGMSESVLRALDIGNKVFTSIFTFECCLKLMALSKEFFQCGWNIFDLIIVSASLLDLIFELVDGLSVLRGLRLLRVLKLAQSWITMKVLLSIIISTIGALGNLTFVLVIVIYIFAVIGMQLFAKDYTPDKFLPDPVPRWNFTDFFHSFMMIFRILCGEWIEPLWDCMRAEREEGPGICLAIFLPTLVMGNFMVLNLFLALLLNSFNSEELKTRKEEVGDESKLAQSFQRIRDIVRKKRQQKDDGLGGDSRLERIVREVMQRRAEEAAFDNKSGATTTKTKAMQQVIGNVYNRSYQEALNRPISIISYEPPEYQEALKETADRLYPTYNNNHHHHHHRLYHHQQFYHNPQQQQKQIEGQTQPDDDEDGFLSNKNNEDNEKKCKSNNGKRLQKTMSSGIGTMTSGESRDEEDELDTEIEIDVKDKEETVGRGSEVVDENEWNEAKTREKDEEKAVENKEQTPAAAAAAAGGASMEVDGNRPWQTLVSYVDELTLGGRKNSKGQYVDAMGSACGTNNFPGFGRRKKPRDPPACFPPHCYERSRCWDVCLQTDSGRRWTSMRRTILAYVDTPAFEWFILVLIFASSVTLCFEDIHLDENPRLKSILYWTNLAFSLIFIVEMVLKWLAHGFHKYFTSFWTLLDFLIVFVSVFSLLIEENENLRVLRSLRTLRALRPLRAISRWQGMRIVVNALMYAIPSIFNVLLVCLVFWLIFSIMGVQFFSGKFYKCLDDDGELLPITVVDNKWECLASNYTWTNSKISFDHVGVAYLALFQVATFEGWMEVMADAVDARGVHLQPQREANLYAYIYFVIFIVCGSFFTLNLFIGVIIDNFNMLKKKYEGGVLEMFLTESQKHYYTAMKKLGRKKPQKVIKRPLNRFLAMFYDLSNSRRFEIAIFVLIFLNMLTMGIEHYDQPHAVFFLLEVSNAFFTTVFGLEAIVKIIGLRYHYFTVPWNVFDFLLVLASILGILMEDIMIDFPVSPTLLRVVRVFRIGRILRLIKAAKGIRKLLFALVVSLPALFNIGALLALITFIYAIIGMFLFGHVRQQGALDDMVNFQTFGRSMHLLFRLITSAGWNDVLESLMIEPPDCDPSFRGQSNGDCGYPLLSIVYFTSFIIINYMIVINMYIAIILENFNQAHQEEEIGIVEDDLEMFYIRWSKYDPHATQFIRFSQLSDFIASLDPPLGISKPNTVALVSFNLPIAKGNRIHCLDILHALVKHVLGHVEETDNFRQLQEQMDIKFKKQFPTRKELEIVSSTRIWKRQDKAARLIQKTFRDYVRRKKEKEAAECEDETTQTSSPGGYGTGWQGRLSAFLHVHRGSRASSRKSSRASDASDLSELGGPWLNLPLLLLSSATAAAAAEDMQLTRESADCNVANEAGGGNATATTPQTDAAPSAVARRRSVYGFPLFLRHQDAVDAATSEHATSATATPSATTPSSSTAPPFGQHLPRSPSASSASFGNLQALAKGKPTTAAPHTSNNPIINTLHPSMAEDLLPKKRGSIIRRKQQHPSTRSSIKLFKQATNISNSSSSSNLKHKKEHKSSSTDVSILVTEASPESPAPRTNSNHLAQDESPQHQQQEQQQQQQQHQQLQHRLHHHHQQRFNKDSSTVVQVLVHRESEEYNQDDEDEVAGKEEDKDGENTNKRVDVDKEQQLAVKEDMLKDKVQSNIKQKDCDKDDEYDEQRIDLESMVREEVDGQSAVVNETNGRRSIEDGSRRSDDR